MISLTTKTRRPTGCGKSRAVESEENQKQVFLPSHRPWKSRKTRGIPTFPTAPTAAGISQTTSGNLIVVDRKECLTPDTLDLCRNATYILHHSPAAAGIAFYRTLVGPSTIVGFFADRYKSYFLPRP